MPDLLEIRPSARVRPAGYEARMSNDVTIVRKRLKSGERFAFMIVRTSETSPRLVLNKACFKQGLFQEDLFHKPCITGFISICQCLNLLAA
jgi:hypothetical protein